MLKTFLLPFLIGVAAIVPFAAQGQVSGEVTYELSTKLLRRQADGRTTLYFDATRSLFRFDQIPKKDSIIENGMTIEVLRSDPEGFAIYKDIRKRQSIYKQSAWIGGAKYIIEDTLSAINWAIAPAETRNIKGYNCQKATGTFGGRTYQVWFTEDIPVSTGPHRLWGLPGLILEAYSVDGKVRFSFVGLRFYPEAKSNIIPPKEADARFVGYKAFTTAQEVVLRKKEKMANASGEGKVMVAMRPPHPDSQIEKHE